MMKTLLSMVLGCCIIAVCFADGGTDVQSKTTVIREQYAKVQDAKVRLREMELKILSLRTELETTGPDLANLENVKDINRKIIEKLLAENEFLKNGKVKR